MTDALFPLGDLGAETLSSARLSPCGTYRYTLDRVWDRRRRAAVFLMLNPSTADASENDPTIRRCIGFAKRNGYGGITVVNLFALRATKPAALALHPDPVGPDNDMWIQSVLFKQPAAVIAAWGAYPPAAGRGMADRATERVAAVLRLVAIYGVPLKCLGTTKDGQPRHPLYLAGSTPLTDYRPPEVAA
jgi:hypothetical protein